MIRSSHWGLFAVGAGFELFCFWDFASLCEDRFLSNCGHSLGRARLGDFAARSGEWSLPFFRASERERTDGEALWRGTAAMVRVIAGGAGSHNRSRLWTSLSAAFLRDDRIFHETHSQISTFAAAPSVTRDAYTKRRLRSPRSVCSCLVWCSGSS